MFITESGEWKLGGFDILSSMKEDDAVIYVGAQSGDVQSLTGVEPRQLDTGLDPVLPAGNIEIRME